MLMSNSFLFSDLEDISKTVKSVLVCFNLLEEITIQVILLEVLNNSLKLTSLVTLIVLVLGKLNALVR
jgi:hypothetical protein